MLYLNKPAIHFNFFTILGKEKQTNKRKELFKYELQTIKL